MKTRRIITATVADSTAAVEELLKEMWKTLEEGNEDKVLIKANPKILKTQREDMKQIEKLIDGIKAAEDHDTVYIQSAITVGYANAMLAHGIITASELQRLNAMIGTIAERRLAEVDKKARRNIFQTVLRFGKATA